jgi:hypothetical protein
LAGCDYTEVFEEKMVHFICAGREGDFPDMSVLNGFCYL